MRIITSMSLLCRSSLWEKRDFALTTPHVRGTHNAVFRWYREEEENIGEALSPNEPRCSLSENGSYQLKFKHESGNDRLDCKLVAVPIGDVLLINLCPSNDNSGVTKSRTLAFSSFKYINPYSSDLTGRFMNLREFSHRFKDNLVTPMKGEILTNAGITNASLSGLPTELKINILGMLGVPEIRRAAQCCREFRELCATLRR
ncbi:uncharacterized protein ntc isoform X2 [Venturia canescens]|uniref:uncharacterized protein ntc isoform X2 n=1 Tax=Venturia canescens TaxID=32260 RepID=UPI001C9D461C|nr:uncharacterized protein LOC122409375 isoform X2 [Venturia canescens]